MNLSEATTSALSIINAQNAGAGNVITVIKEWCLKDGETLNLALDDEVMDGILCCHGIIAQVTGPGGIDQTWHWSPFPFNGLTWTQTAAQGLLLWGVGFARWCVDGEARLIITGVGDDTCLKLTIAGTVEPCCDDPT